MKCSRKNQVLTRRVSEGRPSLTRRVSMRSGITLLEVIISLAIFLFSIAAIGHLVNLATSRAIQAQLRQQAAFLCQSKLAEIAAGAEPMSGQSEMPFSGDETWMWSSSCEEGGLNGLWKVDVRVSREMPDGSKLEVSLCRFILDPGMRGSTADPVPTTNVVEETGTSSGSSSSSGSSTGSSSQPTNQPSTGGGSSSKTPTTPPPNTGKTGGSTKGGKS